MKKLGFGTMRLPLLDANDPKSIDTGMVARMVDLFLEHGFRYLTLPIPTMGSSRRPRSASR